MMSMSVAPKCVAFRLEHNGSYLRFAHEIKEANRSFLEANGEDCISPYTRFYLEPSKEHDGLVHIRCCYNNTYWVAQEQQLLDGSTSGWIIALQRFFHDQLGKHACTSYSSPDKVANCYLHVAENEDNDLDAYTVVDMSQQKELPKYVTFKGDNGKYLSARVIEGYNYLQFSSNDIGDPTVFNTTFTNKDGTVRIKSHRFDRFWRRSPNWIWADSKDTTSRNRDTLFKAIRVGDFFALQNMGNNNFCQRLTTEGKTRCLNAAVKTIPAEAKLKIEEAVVSRTIFNVDFDLKNARIHGKKVLSMATATAVNGTTVKNTVKLTLSYKEKDTRTWDSTVSWKLSVENKVTAGIPLIGGDGSIAIKNEFTGEYRWGSTIEKTVEYKVTIPPKTRVTVSLLASQGSCDVPFSYKQEDVLYDGRVVTYDMNDGLYTGVNCYDFKYETKEEKMSNL